MSFLSSMISAADNAGWRVALKTGATDASHQVAHTGRLAVGTVRATAWDANSRFNPVRIASEFKAGGL
ncbi:MAG: hypothetical protein AB7P76_13155, partial [Candidatus Melainabacteria bacterium]